VVWKGGRPAVGVEVQLIDLASKGQMFSEAPVTDEHGQFSMESFVGRRYKIKVIAWEKAPNGVDYGIADAETEEFVLGTGTPAFRIELDALDRGRSLIRFYGGPN
jgi:hypothetical protein